MEGTTFWVSKYDWNRGLDTDSAELAGKNLAYDDEKPKQRHSTSNTGEEADTTSKAIESRVV